VRRLQRQARFRSRSPVRSRSRLRLGHGCLTPKVLTVPEGPRQFCVPAAVPVSAPPCRGSINAVIHNGGIQKNSAGAIRQATVSISKKPTVFRIPTSGSTYLPINGICNGFDEMGRVLQGERTGSATAACPRRSRTG
jgi:hypothetical protein